MSQPQGFSLPTRISRCNTAGLLYRPMSMQSAPRPCTHAGCHVLVRDGSGRCAKHVKADRQQLDARRGSAHERGYSAAWQRARVGFLRSHPLCVRCSANHETVAASVVDHIIPHRGDMTLFWLHSNWQSLCKRCHDLKTALEDGGFGRLGVR